MIIQNFDQLATTPLRKQALLIAEAGLAAIETRTFVRQHVSYDKKRDRLTIRGKTISLEPFKRVVVVGFGKVAFQAVTELQVILSNRIACGFVIDVVGGELGNITCKIGTHPLPTLVNVAATHELIQMLDACTEEDLVLCVVSGGGSSLLCAPSNMTCDQQRDIIAALTHAGATIQELNIVRKHISEVKGGQLAKICYPATVVSLIFSDVPGNDISLVASGPTVKDTSTLYDAMEILRKHNVLTVCRLPSCDLQETPKEDKYFEKVTNILLCSNHDLLAAMEAKAHDLGFQTRVWNEAYQGEARELGPQMLAATKLGECLLGTGEATVTIRGEHGIGGRNQELALSALPGIPDNTVFMAIDSDGRDNSDTAGALVDTIVQERVRTSGMNLQVMLECHDSYQFAIDVGAAVITGNTGINVSDFAICIKQ